MRLWSLHPKYLDSKGLLALWRETLLARKVLQGKTKGYRSHPQLDRFKSSKTPVRFINTYLLHVYRESCKRVYCFDKKKLGKPLSRNRLAVTEGQLLYEFKHLKSKLRKRNPNRYRELLKVKKPEPNPLFAVRPGPVERWEKT